MGYEFVEIGRIGFDNVDRTHELVESAIRAGQDAAHEARTADVVIRERVGIAWLLSRDPEDWAEYPHVYVVEETDERITVSLNSQPVDDEWTITRLKSQTNIWRRTL